MNGILATAAQAGGVRKLAIVDDAYDPPLGGEISEDAFNRFVQALEDAPAVFAELLEASGIEANDLDDWELFTGNAALVQELWCLNVGGAGNVAVSVELRSAFDLLFSDIQIDRISKLQQLRPLEDLLATMGVDLVKLGSDSTPETVATADVVFLDLFLSSEVPSLSDRGNASRSVLDRARERAMSYLEAVRLVTANDADAVPPAFILISSLGSPQVAANFRKRADQTASRFRFVSKQAVEQQDPLGLLAIAEILRTCRASAVIEPLRKAWPHVVGEAQKWVAQRLVELDISDFARLYQLSLRQEGQQVEDYVKELVAGALAERVTCAFSKHQPTRGGENPFDTAPSPIIQPPSNAFAELYSATRITRDAGYRGEDGSDAMSGDLYMSGQLPKRSSTSLNGRSIVAVMTPICDLMSRDGNPPAATSVLLLEGTLRPTSHKHKMYPQTISLNGRFYEIDWAIKHPQALTFKALKAELKKNEKTWLGRLKAEHFLALQSEYLSSFARVGLLKSPSVFEPLAGQIEVREAGVIIPLSEPFEARSQFAYESPERGKDPAKQPVFFTGEFLDHLRSVLAAVANSQDRRKVTRVKAEGVLERMNQMIDLVTRRPANQHQIKDYLRVDLLENKNQQPANSPDGLILISLWRN